MVHTTGTAWELDPYDWAFQEDPYPVYARLRDEAPVYRNERLDFWALSRHDDVVAASADHATYSSAQGTVLELMTPELEPFRSALPMIIFLDPPAHTVLRRAAARVFTPRRVADLEPSIRAAARRHVDALVAAGGGDLVAELAAPLPMDVIFGLLGIPAGDRSRLRRLIDVSLERDPGVGRAPRRSVAAHTELLAHLRDVLADRRTRPADDLVSVLCTARLGGDRALTDGEVLGFCLLLASAGTETATKLLAAAVVLLGRHPAAAAAVRKNPAQIPAAVEEALRYWAPSQFQGRTTTRAVHLHGVTIPAASRVLLLTGSAARIRRAYPDADRFRLDRPARVAIGFGYGAHACLGAPLARVEVRIALEELLGRTQHIDVDTSGLTHVHMSAVHGFAHVPVAVS